MKGISPCSKLKLLIQRALSKGGLSQFLVPFGMAVLTWLLFVATLQLMLNAGATTMQQLQALRDNLEDYDIFEIAFFHLFSSGDIDQMTVGPGWLVVIIGALLVAAVTSVFTNFFGKLASDYLEGRSDYRVDGHTAIMGFNPAVPELILRLMKEGREGYFLVLTGDVQAARNALQSALGKKRMRSVLLLNGDIASAEDMKRMQLDRASELHIAADMCDPADARDEKCIRCLEHAGKAAAGRNGLPCFLLLEGSAMLPALQVMDTVPDSLALFPMSQSGMWAHKLFLGKEATPLEGTAGIGPDSPDHVHIILIGMNDYALALAREAGHLAHYPNAVLSSELRTRISFIDPAVTEGMKRLECETKGLFSLCHRRFVPGDMPVREAAWEVPSQAHLGEEFMDLEWEFIEGSACDRNIRQYLEECATDAHCRLTVAVCLPDDALSLETAVNLPDSVLASALQIPVLQKRGDATVNLISSGQTVNQRKFKNLKAFGMESVACDLPFIQSLIALASLLEKSPGSGWEIPSKSEAAKLWSNLFSMAHSYTKKRSADAALAWQGDLEEVLARTEHARWNAEQLLLGFRPLSREEQAYVLEREESFADRKAELKREKMAHLDICSWERLHEIDRASVAYDFNLVRQLLGN